MADRIERFLDLHVYQLAFALQQRVFGASKILPAEERYAFTDQVRRSSRSIGAKFSEAWQKRRYPAHFVSKLTDADGELAETRHWIATASACNYLKSDLQSELLETCDRIGKKLGTMIAKPETFCRARD